MEATLPLNFPLSTWHFQLFIVINEFIKSNSSNTIKASGNPIVLKTIAYIENNLANTLSLKEIADYIGLDSFYLSHLYMF